MRLIVALLVLTIPGWTQGEINATTEDGRKVTLYPDGTWKYTAAEVSATARPSSATTNAESIHADIREHCLKEWPEDFQLRAYCERQQREAVNKLAQGKPADITEAEYQQVMRQCISEWDKDFQLIEYCTRQQYEAIRELRGAR